MAASRIAWRQSLRTRIALWSGGMTALLLFSVAVVTVWLMRERIIVNATLAARANTIETAERLDQHMRIATFTARGLASLASTTDLDPPQATAALQAALAASPDIHGAFLALEPTAAGDGYAMYLGANGLRRDLAADGSNYRRQPWYERSIALRKGWWSEPYQNELAGGAWVATYYLPLVRGDGEPPHGVVGMNMTVEDLAAPAESLAHLPGWRATVLAPAGTVVMSSIPGIALHETMESYMRAYNRQDLEPAARAMQAGKAVHFMLIDGHDGGRRYTVVQPVGEHGWTLIVSHSYALIIERLNRALYLLLAACAILAFIGTLLVRTLAKRISRPVEQLAASARRLGSGDYDTPVASIPGEDEAAELARVLEHTRGSIQKQLVEIEQMAAARQRLESELSVAREIQEAMLPAGRTLHLHDHHLEAQAVLEPAKAVGGDFYCFIDRKDGGLWFAIGDVSDKGVPAALFMARTVTALEVSARTADSPSQMLAEASRLLAQGNDTCMFATVLCGHVDVGSGLCTLASAGHDPPVLLRADGDASMLALENGPPLGIEASDSFALREERLAPGDCLIACTDGITEAFNPVDEAYGSDRLLSALQAGRSALDCCRDLIADVHRFAAGAPQSDDIAVLAIRLAEADGPTDTSAPPPGKRPC